MASTLATPIAQAVISLFDGNLGKLLNYGYRPGYGILGATLTEWTPADLFLLGEQGAWYDPSDLTTMFQDAAGTTPVTAAEQPVGLILDKSKGLVLGAELVTNGDFSNGTTGWSVGTGGSAATLSVISQRLRITKTSTATFGSAVQQITGLNASKYYEFYCNGYSGTADVRVLLGASAETGGIYGSGLQSSVNIEPSLYVTGVTSFWITALVYGGNATYAEFDNISVRELPGNHATQATATKRPILSARVNLLTKTEDFSDAVWNKFNGALVSSNAIAAPDGTLTADKVASPVATNSAGLMQIPATATTTVPRLVVRAKAAEYSFIHLATGSLTPSDGATYFATFDLSTGTKVKNGLWNSDATITPLGDGWYECVAIGNQVGSKVVVSFSPTSASISHTGDGTSGIYIWGASLVPADQAALPYQRVNTATDYDTVGFPHYLKFDGIDDALVTGSIDFTATDKMTVVAGVRKLSDAATGMVCELGASGPFSLYNYSLDADIKWTGTTSTGIDAPASMVITGGINQTPTLSSLKINGVSFATAASGVASFSSAPLYIGSRAGTSLPFNGNLYSLIVRGAQSTDAQITSAETWVNSKTGAY